ncbi:MAG: FMN-binding protein, partial [Erysipelotrichaceae bacterium]|nr:FMN-binding protein [Erysipelotrichaceae bacterium]
MRKMEKLLAAVLSVGMLASCSSSTPTSTLSATASASTGSASIADGEYEGEATGNNGPVDVKVTIKDGAISNVEVTNNSESQGIGDVAIEKVSSDIVAHQTTNVDNVTGATITASAVKTAVRNALESAGASKDDF